MSGTKMSEPAMARTITIERCRLRRWLDNFAQRHPGIDAEPAGDRVQITASDGAIARVEVPFPPLSSTSSVATPGSTPFDATPSDATPSDATPSGASLLDRLVSHVGADRYVGAILVRKGGFAAGVFHGVELISSKVGTGYVQSKTKAGGWSQQRYARRRDNQARQLYDRAASTVEAILIPQVDHLVAVATGGDRDGVAAVTQQPRLAPLHSLLIPGVLPVADPRHKVLASFPDQFLAVRIELNDQA